MPTPLPVSSTVDTFLRSAGADANHAMQSMQQAQGFIVGVNQATFVQEGTTAAYLTANVRIGSGAGDAGDSGEGTNTSDQIAIGYEAGKSRTSAGSDKCVNIGRHAGDHGSGTQAICIGDGCGQGSKNNAQSVFAGYLCGRNLGYTAAPTPVVYNSFQCVMLGYETATGATTASGDTVSVQTGVFIGSQCAKDTRSAIGAVMIGYASGYTAQTAADSVIIGNYSGYGHAGALTATGGVLIGGYAGYNSTAAAYSVILGWEAGYNATAAGKSVLIGYRAGKSLSRANTLIIDGNDTYSTGATGLIYGEFDNRILTFNGGVTVNGISTASALTVAAGTITTSQPPITVTQDWNGASSAVVFTGIKAVFTKNGATNGKGSINSTLLDLRVTNSADNSGASSLLFDGNGCLMIGQSGTLGTSVANLGVAGPSGGIMHCGCFGGFAALGNTYNYGGSALVSDTKIAARSDMSIGWSADTTSYGTLDAFFRRKAAATIQMGVDAAGVTNQVFTAANRITSDGVGANLTIAPGNGRGGAGGSLILSTFTTAAAATAGTLTTRLTLDTAGLLTFADAVDMAFNTTTGTKIGTATGQKIGFWNATPVVQQVLATGAAHTVDDVITFLQTVGLCKQS